MSHARALINTTGGYGKIEIAAHTPLEQVVYIGAAAASRLLGAIIAKNGAVAASSCLSPFPLLFSH